MASILWWRSWHGAPMDHKWPVVAARAGVKVGVVSAVAWALFDYASQNEPRGSVTGFDEESYSVYSGFTQDEIRAVITAMTEKGFIEDGRIKNWNKPPDGIGVRLPDDLWRKIRLVVFVRDNYTCQYCGRKIYRPECDHVIPVSQGGSNEIENLVTACVECNRSKGSKTLDDWRSWKDA